jgi:hypothetical protein
MNILTVFLKECERFLVFTSLFIERYTYKIYYQHTYTRIFILAFIYLQTPHTQSTILKFYNRMNDEMRMKMKGGGKNTTEKEREFLFFLNVAFY